MNVNQVASAVRSLGAEPVWFEEFGGRDADAEDAYLGEVAVSTIYVGILGRDYGRILKTHLAATHAEYVEAERLALRICVWTKAGAQWIRHQQRLVDEIRTFHVTNDFETAGQLADSVTKRMRSLAAEDLSPWCKIGQVVFRASRIADDGQTVQIDAALRNHAVITALEAMRPSWWSGSSHQVTYAGRSRTMEVSGVTSLLKSSWDNQRRNQAQRHGVAIRRSTHLPIRWRH